MHGMGVCMAGGHVWQGGMHGKGGRRDGHCSGRTALYWNAFLLSVSVSVSVSGSVNTAKGIKVYYRPQTKLREGNVAQASVCLTVWRSR